MPAQDEPEIGKKVYVRGPYKRRKSKWNVKWRKIGKKGFKKAQPADAFGDMKISDIKDYLQRKALDHVDDLEISTLIVALGAGALVGGSMFLILSAAQKKSSR